MLGLRPYKPCDAQKILSWCRDEKTFLGWGGTHIGEFPLSEKVMNETYFENNGNCAEPDNFFPMTAFDGDEITGHFILRYIGDRKTLRFGWVIVDDKKRGTGCGKEMVMLGLKYAFEVMNAEKVTIGVYANNPAAYHCYRSSGFTEAAGKAHFDIVKGEKWKIIEMELTREEYLSRN